MMRDNLRRSRAICNALLQASPAPPTGTLARPLHTLAALRSGIVGSQSPPRPHLAAQVPHGTQPASRGKRLARCCDNAPSLEAGYFLPSAAILLPPFAFQPLVLVMDGRVAGRGGMALRRHVVEKGRALPRAGRGRQGPQGPVRAALPSALVARGSGRSAAGAPVVVRGDGALAGPRLPHTVQRTGWASGGRPGGHRTAWGDGTTLRRDTWGAWRTPGPLVAVAAVWCTRAASGPLRRICGGAKGCQAPLYVVTHRDTAEAACRLAAKRVRIAPVCSDQHSRGWHRHTSPRADPQRLARLFIATC
jgi:hypothetical protein